MNVGMRRQELKRIEEENARMAMRIITAKGTVQKQKDVLKDFEHH
jgi:hypothetical protein